MVRVQEYIPNNPAQWDTDIAKELGTTLVLLIPDSFEWIIGLLEQLSASKFLWSGTLCGPRGTYGGLPSAIACSPLCTARPVTDWLRFNRLPAGISEIPNSLLGRFLVRGWR